MAEITAVEVGSQQQGEKAFLDIEELSDNGEIHLLDAAMSYTNKRGKVRLRQTTHATGRGTAWGGGLGLVLGFLVGGPLAGLVLGGAAGAIVGRGADVGVDNGFMKQIQEHVEAGKCVVFVQTETAEGAEKVRERLGQYGEVISTSIPDDLHEQVSKEREAAAA